MSLRAVIRRCDLFGLVGMRSECNLQTPIVGISTKHYNNKTEDMTIKVSLKDQTGNVLGIKTLNDSKILAKKMRLNLIEEKEKPESHYKYKVFKLVSNQYLAQFERQSTPEELDLALPDHHNIDPKKSESSLKIAKDVKRLVFSAKLESNDLLTKINGIKRWLFRGHPIAVQVINSKNDKNILDEIYNKFETELKGIAKLNQKKIKSDNTLKFMVLPTIDTKDQLNVDKSHHKSNKEFHFEDLDPNQLLSDGFEEELDKK